MLKYVEDLVAERDHLTEMATALGDTAHDEGRQLSDAEAAQLGEWQTRCAELDSQIESHSKVLESTRKWADLKGRLEAGDTPPTPRRRAPGRAVEVRSAGQTFIDSDIFKDYTGAGSSSWVHLPGVLETRSWQTRAAGDPITTGDLSPDGWPGLIAPYLFEAPRPRWDSPLLGLVNVEPIGSGSVEYFYFEPADPGPAPVVAEGAAKPPADIKLVLKAAPLQTFAWWKAITRQALEDFPRIRTIVEDYLRRGVINAMEGAVGAALNADTNVQTVANASLLAAIRLGAAMVDDQGFTANGVLLNATDWANMDVGLLYSTLGGPTGATNFWGLTPVASNTVAEGTAYVGDFRDGVTFFDRRVTDVRLTDSHAGYFVENKIVVLAEGRGLAAVTQPLAIVKCEGDATPVAPPDGTNAARVQQRRQQAAAGA